MALSRSEQSACRRIEQDAGARPVAILRKSRKYESAITAGWKSFWRNLYGFGGRDTAELRPADSGPFESLDERSREF
jgi:hypothetical protein